MDSDTTFYVDISDVDVEVEVESECTPGSNGWSLASSHFPPRSEEGKKNTKPERFDLLPWDALEEVARVYDFGSKKYSDRNWELGYKWGLSYQALVRHIVRFWLGEDKDPESGYSHMAHATFHCLCLLAFFMRGCGTDDRPKERKR
jgi:hypothetical protein